MPPSWGGMTGSGADAMFSLGGRWLKAGQKTPQGHTIDSYDPKTGFLGMSYAGVPLMPLKMRDTVVQDYKPLFTKEQQLDTYLTQAEFDAFQGAQSAIEDPTMQVDFDIKPYQGFNKEQMEQIKNNVLANPNINYKNNGVVSFDEYQNLVKGNKAQEGIYIVPYNTEDGGVDLRDFYFEGYKPQ